MVETILNGEQILALIVSGNNYKHGIEFFTPPEWSQQLAAMKHSAGHIIQPHVHNPVPREVHYTQEVLVIKSGKLRVDFYDDNREYLESRILDQGDVIVLAGGGHGFEVLEDLEMLEIKQGPHAGEKDKTRFTGITAQQTVLRNKTND